ncbi:MAG: hypothetical protein JSS63_11105 [Bacteroidetes bacterium]|nr:hypothetical protein [Bacteroidota bacterium]
MINLGGINYKLCLIDTCVISEILKNKKEIGSKIVPKFINERIMFCYTIQTIAELRKAPDIYNEFFSYMSIMPSFLLKNYNQLTEDEINSYVNKKSVDPILFHIAMMKPESYYKEYQNMFERKELKHYFDSEKIDAPDTLKALLDWRGGFPPEKENYSTKEIEHWVELVSLKQILITHPEYYKRNITNLEAMNYTNFKSWNMIAYIVFYKFYFRHRNPKVNDVNDILIVSALPYLDIIITEKDMCEQLRQIKAKHDIINHVELYTIKSFIK